MGQGSRENDDPPYQCIPPYESDSETDSDIDRDAAEPRPGPSQKTARNVMRKQRAEKHRTETAREQDRKYFIIRHVKIGKICSFIRKSHCFRVA